MTNPPPFSRRACPPRSSRGRRGGHARRLDGGFTLVEVLATVMLIAIVLPAINGALVSATSVAAMARHRTEAGGLAESKVAELTATAQWQNGGSLAGDFGADWPEYKWQATLGQWAGDVEGVGLEQLDVTVTWTASGRAQQVVATGLVYVRPTASTTTN